MNDQAFCVLDHTNGEIIMKQPKTIESPKVTEPITEPNGNNVLDFSATLKDLRNGVDPQFVKQRTARRFPAGSPFIVDYVEWHTVADILDEYASEWEHAIKDIRLIGEIVTITVAITIDGVTREGIGTGRANSETGIKKAEHDGLKRAAVKFGIARELYKREFEPSEIDQIAETVAPTAASIEDPIARSLGDIITTKQLGMIKALSKEGGLNSNAECENLFRCRVDELSKRAASELITYLQSKIDGSARAVTVPLRRAG